ncbi:MAG: circadian clock protein KaiC, partial [Candidatus Tectomicrobia bacterium]|nr:circadian clock protein KaiC [Candidatus Tectomicrobia bacterium]
MVSSAPLVKKLATHIPGFDLIAEGGLPIGRTTLLAGTSGSAKTVFAVQFLAQGILQEEESGVFVTFEESPADIRINMRSFGWDITQWEADGRWAFVDASPQPEDETIVAGSYDLGALLARISYAIEHTGATRIALDSLGSVFTRFQEHSVVRREFFRIAAELKQMWLTSIMTAEREEEYGSVSRYGVEEFVADNVILLRNVLENEKRRRTIEALKFRGTSHQKGEFPFTVSTEKGVTVIPVSSVSLMQPAPSHRITSGNADLDRMCGGGFFRGAIVLVSGATGTGKTLLSTEFIAGGAT